MDAFRLVVVVIGLANVGLLAYLVLKVRDLEQRFCEKVLRSLQTIEKRPAVSPWNPSLSHQHRGGGSARGEFFVCWQWLDENWKCQRDLLPRGAEVGLPPTYPGSYRGQIVKTWVGAKA